MPRDKDLKRLARTRMQKTGESYTTARAQLLNKKPKAKATPKPPYATIAGIADEKVKEATGCTWERWVKALDAQCAYELSHRDMAKLVKAKYKTPDWWTQTVVIGYERIKGLRAKGQQRDGSYQASKTKTFNMSAKDLEKAVKRMKWPKEKNVRVDVVERDENKSAIAMEALKLSSEAAADDMKAKWAARFTELAHSIATKS